MTTARPFTPTREDPHDLDARTVGSDAGDAIDRIAARIDAAADGNLAHTLVLGPRGAGKTHALAVGRQRASALRRPGRAVAVVVPEDAHGIVTFLELLAVVARGLGTPLGPDERTDVGRAEEAVARQLGKQVLVLVVENLDRLFAKLGRAGQHDLRGWVEMSRRVLVLGSTPMLFDGVQKRDEPWFGSFVVEPLGDLTAAEGADLLRHLRADDPDLLAFLALDAGAARVEALHALTGGSPRLWTIFADVVTVDLLDDLVPAVERLLEDLVTYYQQRLWDLGPNEERVVIALATGAVSQTATGLARDLGLDRNTTGTTLGRLEEARWLRGTKVEGTDQRSTWYELREPLLRHYLQYRNETMSELTLIVEMLRHWFDPAVLEHHMVSAAPGSVAERYVATTLDRVRPAAYDDGYVTESAEGLLLQARRWAADRSAPDGFAEAGIVVEGLLAHVDVGEARPCPTRLRPVVAAASAAVAGGDASAPKVGQMLDAAATAAEGRVSAVLAWLAAAWRISTDPADAERRLDQLADQVTGVDDVLALHVAHDRAWLAGGREPDTGVALLDEVVARRGAVQGADHRDTLRARSNRAYYLGESGDGAGALVAFREVVADSVRVLGLDHPDTLRSRHQVAWYERETGDPVGALVTSLGVVAAIQAPVDSPPMRGKDLARAARSLAAACLTEVVRDGRADEVPAAARTGLVAAVLDGVGGSAAARAQVPIELRPLVDRVLRAATTAPGSGAGVEG